MKEFFKKYQVIITLAIAIGLWLFSVPFLRELDPSAGIFDAGVFQIPIFSIILLIVFLAVSWALMRVIFGTHYKYLSQKMKTDYENILPWQRLILSYSVFFLLLYAMVQLAKVLVVTPLR